MYFGFARTSLRSSARGVIFLFCVLCAEQGGAGVWSEFPDSVARLRARPGDAEALQTLETAEAFMVGQAVTGRLPAVMLLLEVYSGLVVSMADGDERIRRTEGEVADGLVKFGDRVAEKRPVDAARAWTLALRIDAGSAALDRLRDLMQPPEGPEPGQIWRAPPDFSEMVFHPAAQFRLGCSLNDGLCEREERFFRWAKVADLWIGRFEIDNRHYRLCVDAGACSRPEEASSFDDAARADHPVVGVTWGQANNYARWTARRLPSAAEWERAARGVEMGHRFPWGNRRHRERANVHGVEARDTFEGTAPAGSFETTGLGIFDIAGNVWEWVEDRYHANMIGAPIDGSAWVEGGLGRTVRGGSWRRSIEVARVSSHFWQEEGYAFDDVGFRCAVDASVSLSPTELAYRAESFFPIERNRGRALTVPGFDASDRMYLQRRIVTWAVLEGREIEGLPIAASMLRRSKDEAAALDLIERVRAQLLEDAAMGRVEAVEHGYRQLGSAIRGKPSLAARFEGLAGRLAASLKREGQRQRKKSAYGEAIRCFEAALELDPGSGETRRLLNAAAPEAGSLRIWPTDQRDMVWIPGGSFRFGASIGDRRADPDEHPARTLPIRGFWLDRTEVTNDEYRRCVEAGACSQPVLPESYDNPARGTHPVVGVTWFQARAYARWSDKRLPSEVEWERAARLGQTSRYPWGDEWQAGRANGAGAGEADFWSETAPVGSCPADGWGAADLIGNAAEWVADIYHRDFLQAPSHSQPWTQLTGGQVEGKRVVRGGSYLEQPDDLRSSEREDQAPDNAARTIGFRCAADAW